jgi:hypothetical protein
MSFGVRLKTSGPYACLARPEMKIERVSKIQRRGLSDRLSALENYLEYSRYIEAMTLIGAAISLIHNALCETSMSRHSRTIELCYFSPSPYEGQP